MSSHKLIESWVLLGYFAVIFLPWAQLRAQSQAIFRDEKTTPWDFLKLCFT